MPDCSSASSVAISARRSVRPVDEEGSTVTKSTVPAIVDFRPSIGKRVTVRMPDSPAVSFFQLSCLAGAERGDDAHAGNDDDRPAEFVAWCCHDSPVDTATSLLDGLDQGHAFALPVTGPHDHNLGRRLSLFNLEPGRIVRRKQRAARDRKCRQRQPQRKLGFQRVAERSFRSRARQNRDACAGTLFLPMSPASTPVAPVIRLPLSPVTPSFGHSVSSDFVTAPGCLRCARSATTLLSLA